MWVTLVVPAQRCYAKILHGQIQQVLTRREVLRQDNSRSLMVRVGQNCMYTPYTHNIHTVLTNPIYDRIFVDFPAKITVYTQYIYGSGHPYIWPYIQ